MIPPINTLPLIPFDAFPPGTIAADISQLPPLAPLIHIGVGETIDANGSIVLTPRIIAVDAAAEVGTWEVAIQRVPEPTSLALAVLGLTVLAVAVRPPKAN